MHKHYIAMSGISGCLPDFCASCDSFEEAVSCLADVHELEDAERAELDACGFLRLEDEPNWSASASYCEIMPCSCDTPEVHND